MANRFDERGAIGRRDARNAESRRKVKNDGGSRKSGFGGKCDWTGQYGRPYGLGEEESRDRLRDF